jgi:hypothetical protein
MTWKDGVLSVTPSRVGKTPHGCDMRHVVGRSAPRNRHIRAWPQAGSTMARSTSMPSRLPLRHCIAAALFAGLASLPAGAWADPPARAVLEPAPGVQVGYERLGPQDTPSPPGRFDGALATPAGTLRTTVREEPADERRFRRGDTTFDLPASLAPGRIQFRDREAGGAAAEWSAPLGAGLTAEAQGEKTPVRAGQAVQVRQEFGGRQAARAQVSGSKTAAAQGSRWDLEWTRATSQTRWTAGIDAADRSYVSPSGGLEPRAGLRLGTQYLVLPHTTVQARYTRQVRWDAQEPVSAVMFGTRFDLPRRLSLVTGVEMDTEAGHKASATLTVPLEVR